MPAAMVPIDGAQNAVCANERLIEHCARVFSVGDVPRVRVFPGRAAVSSYASLGSWIDRSAAPRRGVRNPIDACGQGSGGAKNNGKNPGYAQKPHTRQDP